MLITRRIVFDFFMVFDLQTFIIFIVSCDIDDWQIEILQIKKIINCCINMLNIHIQYFFVISMFPLYSNVLNLLFQIFVQIWNTRCVNYSFRIACFTCVYFYVWLCFSTYVWRINDTLHRLYYVNLVYEERIITCRYNPNLILEELMMNFVDNLRSMLISTLRNRDQLPDVNYPWTLLKYRTMKTKLLFKHL